MKITKVKGYLTHFHPQGEGIWNGVWTKL